MHFDLADLRLFIHIGESPSLTQGARRAFLSPAAASARIKALEGQLGTRLLYERVVGALEQLFKFVKMLQVFQSTLPSM